MICLILSNTKEVVDYFISKANKYKLIDRSILESLVAVENNTFTIIEELLNNDLCS